MPRRLDKRRQAAYEELPGWRKSSRFCGGCGLKDSIAIAEQAEFADALLAWEATSAGLLSELGGNLYYMNNGPGDRTDLSPMVLTTEEDYGFTGPWIQEYRPDADKRQRFEFRDTSQVVFSPITTRVSSADGGLTQFAILLNISGVETEFEGAVVRMRDRLEPVLSEEDCEEEPAVNGQHVGSECLRYYGVKEVCMALTKQAGGSWVNAPCRYTIYDSSDPVLEEYLLSRADALVDPVLDSDPVFRYESVYEQVTQSFSDVTDDPLVFEDVIVTVRLDVDPVVLLGDISARDMDIRESVLISRTRGIALMATIQAGVFTVWCGLCFLQREGRVHMVPLDNFNAVGAPTNRALTPSAVVSISDVESVYEEESESARQIRELKERRAGKQAKDEWVVREIHVTPKGPGQAARDAMGAAAETQLFAAVDGSGEKSVNELLSSPSVNASVDTSSVSPYNQFNGVRLDPLEAAEAYSSVSAGGGKGGAHRARSNSPRRRPKPPTLSPAPLDLKTEVKAALGSGEDDEAVAEMLRQGSLRAKRLKAAFDFVGKDRTELTFEAGDVLTVVAQHESGWWTGELRGRIGLFPVEYTDKTTARESRSPSPVAGGDGKESTAALKLGSNAMEKYASEVSAIRARVHSRIGAAKGLNGKTEERPSPSAATRLGAPVADAELASVDPRGPQTPEAIAAAVTAEAQAQAEAAKTAAKAEASPNEGDDETGVPLLVKDGEVQNERSTSVLTKKKHKKKNRRGSKGSKNSRGSRDGRKRSKSKNSRGRRKGSPEDAEPEEI